MARCRALGLDNLDAVELSKISQLEQLEQLVNKAKINIWEFTVKTLVSSQREIGGMISVGLQSLG